MLHFAQHKQLRLRVIKLILLSQNTLLIRNNFLDANLKQKLVDR